ncbi:hypothetical protein [Marinilactibacillus kalidii]|uniref:hypothetical protein n=1 Tax=Marinilactibacillus kalidii TaxID=2820274 RepID=UPI001ABE4234|nr:hypothetical protein [Marinilactibacillus kalidii]
MNRHKLSKTVGALVVLSLLNGCASETSEKEMVTETPVEKDDTTTDLEPVKKVESADEVDEDKAEIVEETEEVDDTLAAYSNEEIEYARIWLQLGATQDIDELSVEKIPKGSPLNSEDEASAVYPEPVVHLSGSRLAEGSITYSSNGNGTIDVYPVPHRWEMLSSNVKIENGVSVYTQKLLDRKERVSVDVGDTDAIEALIQKEQIE